MRPLVQYDFDESPTGPSAPLPTGPHPNVHRPPKKRKRNHHNAQKPPFGPPHKAKAPVQHWDDPGSAAVGMVYDDEGSTSIPAGSVAVSYKEEEGECDEEAADGDEGADVDIDPGQEEEEEEEEESRPLTHDEIWDDSALVDAWHSAEAEYEAYHGTSKAWKTEPVKKSPLWYNKPYTTPQPKPGPSKSKPRPPQVQPQGGDEPEPDSAPLDFDTYVPTHDPSLASAAPAANPAPFFVPPPSTTTVSRDEAFNNALSAMYWSGYWTAVYHSQSQTRGKSNDEPAEATEEDEIEVDEDEEDQDLVPAQR